MPKYRKKPVVIEAIEWTGENLSEIATFTARNNISNGHLFDMAEYLVKKEGLKIYTLEGVMDASIGDFIIRGVSGEFYPCKPDIFKKTYERVE